MDNSQIVSVGKIDVNPDKLICNYNCDDLPLLPTRDFVLFPGVTAPLSLGRPQSKTVAKQAFDNDITVGVVCQRLPDIEEPSLLDLFEFGVTVKVLQVFDLPDGEQMAIVHAVDKFKIIGIGEGHVLPAALSAKVKPMGETKPRFTDTEFDVVVAGIKRAVHHLAPGWGPRTADIEMNLKLADTPVAVVNIVATQAPLMPRFKIELLKQVRLKERAFKLLAALNQDEQRAAVYREVMDKTKSMIDEQQRKNVLRVQLDAIKDELYGEDEDISNLRSRGAATLFPDNVRAIFDKELDKLERLAPMSPDYSVQYTYLNTLLSLPWGITDEGNNDFAQAERVLNSEHYGLEKVKERILEQLAVVLNAPDSRAPILCLAGAPGVGKTSLGVSIARAMGRKYERVALGGLHDEAEIRGHRRTYIGAMPGRIIASLNRAASSNPVILLDEIDKISNDYHGDPSAALLEVLDPEQNFRFHDNYVDVDFDLSKVLFIATANSVSAIPQPLLDRMELIEISGYLLEEKIEIARRHLIPRIERSVGLDEGAVEIPVDTIAAIVEQYTGESGVRQLEKNLASLMRKLVLGKMRGNGLPERVTPDMLHDYLGVAPYNKERYEGNDFTGVVTGLAWTSAGGEILFIESSVTPGNTDRPAPTLTGNLGNVMKESATIALQYVRAHAAQIGLTEEDLKKNVHIHVPEGAVPKDGPSAGITMATSIASALTGRKVRQRLAMTGEITLRGKVLPVGGIKEKILAAKRAGIDKIVLSSANRKNVEEIKEEYRRGLEFIYVDTVAEVLDYALLDKE